MTNDKCEWPNGCANTATETVVFESEGKAHELCGEHVSTCSALQLYLRPESEQEVGQKLIEHYSKRKQK